MEFENGEVFKGNEPEVISDEEIIKAIEREIAPIDASNDQENKDIKLKSLEIVGKLKTETDPEKKKDLILELRTGFGLIDTFHGDELDKESKIKAQDLIEKLYKKNN